MEALWFKSGCDRIFNGTTGTRLAGLHPKDRHFQQCVRLVRRLSVRGSAAKLGVSASNAFRESQSAGSRHMTRLPKLSVSKATAKCSPRDLVAALVSHAHI